MGKFEHVGRSWFPHLFVKAVNKAMMIMTTTLMMLMIMTIGGNGGYKWVDDVKCSVGDDGSGGVDGAGAG